MDDTYISMYICEVGIVWRGVRFSILANKVTQSCEKESQYKESHGHLVEMAPSWCRGTNCHGVGHKDRVTFGIRLVPECECRGSFNQQRDELYLVLNGKVIQIDHDLREGTSVNRLRKGTCGETMASKEESSPGFNLDSAIWV